MTAAPPLVVVAGVTATGKTGLGIRLAEWVIRQGRPAVVISADSRQVFRGLDIGTAKVGPEDRARVPHHGLDLVDPDQPFSVADFANHARAVLDDLAAQDGVALLVGGTGLYLRTIARGLDTAALPSDPAIRARPGGADPRRSTPGASWPDFRTSPPAAPRPIDLHNPRRVVRALEIAEIVGDRPLPVRRRATLGPAPGSGCACSPRNMRVRIAARARAQFDAGLIEEARALRERFDPDLPAFSAIGYREAWAVIDGEMNRDEAIALDAQRNLQFAKRQATWFRSEPEIAWLDAAAPGLDAAATAVVAGLLDR